MKPTRFRGLFLVLLTALFCLPLLVNASPPPDDQASKRLTREEVPEPLRPWIDWALWADEAVCPFFQGLEDRLCGWSSRLDLSLDGKGGTFSQQWRLFQDGWVSLPGDEERWPLDLKVDGRPSAAVPVDAAPSLFLKKGDHAVTGQFAWDSLPESFQIPAETALVRLTLRGQAVPFPNFDEEGALWLESAPETEAGAEEALDVRVHRHLLDEIPFLLTTQIQIDAAGKGREVNFGNHLPEGFVSISLESPLPARIAENGDLRVQVRPGRWEVELQARHQGPVQEIVLPGNPETQPSENGSLWPSEEVWVFEARNDLRLVSVERATPVDPQQTTLPDKWKRLPAYRMTPGETIAFDEKRRGDADPAPDQISLHRDLWLDFNGQGYTIQDRIAGQMHRSFRLEMNPPVILGRVSARGQDQLITRLPNDPKMGIEIRQGDLSVEVDSRLEKQRFSVPAVGWNHDFQKVDATLHLPPGWGVFSIWGADHVPSTWINRWSLLEIFLVFLLSIAAAKIWDRRWGVATFLTLVLIFPEEGAPQWSWLAAIIGIALIKAIPRGKILSLLRLYRLATLILLILFCVPFAVHQIRIALYPSLEQPSRRSLSIERQMVGSRLSQAINEPQAVTSFEYENAPLPPPAPAPMAQPEEAVTGALMEEDEDRKGAPRLKVMMKMKREVVAKDAIQAQEVRRFPPPSVQQIQNIPGAKIQTGPGLPRWDWRRVDLQWTGMVERGQRLRLFLIPPFFNLILAFVRVFLLGLLLLCFLGFPGHAKLGWINRLGLTLPFLAVLLTGLFVPQTARASDFPTPEILQELRGRMTEEPTCFPECASIPRMILETTENLLRIRFEVGAEAETAIPLPGITKDWSPSQVSIDGQKFAALHRGDDGRAWVQIPKGFHQVLLEGTLVGRQTVQIPLPFKPHHLQAKVSGWSLQGLGEDGEAQDNLQLTRQQGGTVKSAEGNIQSTELSPFVRVERRLLLGLTWEVETRVVRLSPEGTAISLSLPLLDGESIMTSGMKVENGKVAANLPPQSSEIQWRSVLKEAETIALKAPDVTSWVELWQLDASPIWHFESSGIPRIHQQDTQGMMPTWRPWPGETVTLKISRPEGVAGQTLTIDESLLSLIPGLRFTEATLSLGLRSSLGGQQALTIPQKAEVQSVSIDGQTQPIRQVGETVTVPVVPGAQRIEVQWRQPGGIGIFFQSPPIGLGTQSVNAEIKITIPPKRWILFVGGPRLGPAILFWSLLIVFGFASWGLGRTDLTPLKDTHWFLLGLGLTQTSIWGTLLVVGWLLLLGWRRRHITEKPWPFSLSQIAIAFVTVIALITLASSIYQGLLGVPDMQISGNGSTDSLLRWFQDRSPETLPRPWTISVPLFCYRLGMLAWALWIAWALVSWLKWGWRSFGEGGFWKSLGILKKKA